jgi:D-glycero-D-manno-heptose 1,7-bisphosphate phosphatase
VSLPAGQVVVLDRDGVINEDSSEYIKSVAEWRPIPGSLEGIATLHRAGFVPVVVTNQSGLARGLFTEDVLAAIHREMLAAVRTAGGEIAGIYYCPHHPDDGCDCRKPRVGLLRRVERDFGCSLAGAPLIGDQPSDVATADAIRARPILVRTGKGATTERSLAARGLTVFDDLRAAAAALAAERS